MAYTAKLLRVDLEREKVSVEEVGEPVLRDYIGGSGLAARLLWQETGAGTEPFSPENRLAFMVGPLSGSAPLSSRYHVCAISPATSAWGAASAGGKWPTELSRTGFSGIVFSGRARRPVYLYVNEEKAELRDAGHLWGKDTYEVNDLLQRETDSKACVATIGRAGEKLVRLAGVMSEGRIGRAAARCGMGAVMGSKNLKAVVVRGTRKPGVARASDLKATNQEVIRHLTRARETSKNFSFRAFMESQERIANDTFRNHSMATVQSFLDKVDSYEEGKPFYCDLCPVGCVESRLSDDGSRAIVILGLLALGSNCLVDDMPAIRRAWELCQQYGIDTVSVGFAVAFGMECFEEGLISRNDTGGLELTWGNGEALVEMVRQIGEAEGFGKVLGQGVKRAAEQIGGKAHLYAMHVKGLEVTTDDPRAYNSIYLGYATSNRGADAMEFYSWALERKVFPGSVMSPDKTELGYPMEGLNRLVLEGKAGLVRKTQDVVAAMDALPVCIFSYFMHGVRITSHIDWLNAVTGWDMDMDEFMKTGERIFNLRRLINLRRGLTAKDDSIPPRYLTSKHPRLEGIEGVPSKSELDKAIKEYYGLRGWTQAGVPTARKLKELGLAKEER